jgi:acetyl-CoA acetyltransferase
MTKQIQDAYIVAATRTPVGKAPKGMFRNTRPDDMLAHVLRSVVAQARAWTSTASATRSSAAPCRKPSRA